MSEPTQKTFDIASGRIMAGGKQGYIQYSLSTTRYVEYLKSLPRLSFNTTFRGLYDTMSKIYMICASGNDILYANGQSRELAWNQLEAIKRFDENDIIDAIHICALFINFEGEDISKFDTTTHESKKIALNEEGYDVNCFFALLENLISGFSEASHKIKAKSQGAEVDIRLKSIEQT